MKSGVLALALALAGLAGSAAMAESTTSVVLVPPSGRVCAGEPDVMWGAGDGKIMRWRRRDGTIGEVAVPDLRHPNVARRVIGCAVKADGSVDLYYGEGYRAPGAPSEDTGRTQTIWLTKDRHRILLDIEGPEGGYVEDAIRIFPELGISVHDLVVERMADGLTHALQVPEGTYVIGLWAAPEALPSQPPALVACYAYPLSTVKVGGCVAVAIGTSSIEQRPLDVDSRDINLMNRGPPRIPNDVRTSCVLKGRASPGYAWPQRAAFDCFGDSGPYFAVYPVDNGLVVWRQLQPDRVCRQRSIGIDAVVVQVNCFRVQGDALHAALPFASQRWVAAGHEYPSASGWTMSITEKAARPVEGQLIPVSDQD